MPLTYHVRSGISFSIDRAVAKEYPQSTSMSESTSNLTRFFRHSAQLKSLEHHWVPDLLAGRDATDMLKVWCVGCSTGEEAYTLAILLNEILPAEMDFAMRAIDRERDVLKKAERGLYNRRETAGIPKRFLDRYFHVRNGEYEVVEKLSSRISFELESIEGSSERGVYDLVLCRNVLTYANEAGRRLIAERLWEAMSSPSYVVVGGSESLFGLSSRFGYLSDEWSSAYRKRLPV